MSPPISLKSEIHLTSQTLDDYALAFEDDSFVSKSFGINLKELMKNKRVAPGELARELQVPYKTVQDWLASGNRMPRSPEVLKKISNYFGCSIEFLLFGEDSAPNIEQLFSSVKVHSGLYRITFEKVIEKK